ncbi:MAG: hypothetical protein JNL96_06590 [Planctomycetaceae bacterium]|nr:hypothetical protein [Planctomycetaceae bacterium]
MRWNLTEGEKVFDVSDTLCRRHEFSQTDERTAIPMDADTAPRRRPAY